MSDRRREILGAGLKLDGTELHNEDAVLNAMDEYMKECCLELLSFLSDHDVKTGYVDADSGDDLFLFKGSYITKEHLFENFL